MRIMHLADLHIGKKVNGFSMIEDQRHILNQILQIFAKEKPDCVLIAGDVYDKSIPSTEATELLDDFFVNLAKQNAQVFVISGNHDSPERLAFGNRLIDASGIHLSPVYNGSVTPFALNDEYGVVNIYMLPFVKPAIVRKFFQDQCIESYNDAVKVCIDQMQVDCSVRNVIVTHQFVTGASRSESEDLSVGGADNIDALLFTNFDYVALGHIHGPQRIHSDNIRYSGSPLKYSFSEVKHNKSVIIADLKEKGNLSIKAIPLFPLHDMVELRGTYQELTAKNFYEGTTFINDYVHITLTDEDDIINALEKLRSIYRNLMKLDYDNTRTRHNTSIQAVENVERKTPLEMFGELFKLQNGIDMTEQQTTHISKLIEKIWEENK